MLKAIANSEAKVKAKAKGKAKAKAKANGRPLNEELLTGPFRLVNRCQPPEHAQSYLMEKRKGRNRFIVGTSHKMSCEYLKVMGALLKECEEKKYRPKTTQ